MSTPRPTSSIWPNWKSCATAHDQIREQIARQIVGQDEVVEQLLMAVFARGHCILEGVPGLAKTLMVHSLAQSLSLDFNRIQFTPDLMPSDITGTEVLYEDRSSGARELRFVHGPIFANLILADEINRTPPKTQAALLEAMQERQVTAGGRRHALPDPFFVLATQNPIEQEGTYPLPEAQLDRFLFKIFITYPKPEEERRIYRLTTGRRTSTRSRRCSPASGSRPCSGWCGGCPSRTTASTTRWTWSGRPAAPTHGGPDVHRRLGRLGRRPARRSVADPGRQGPRRPGRPAQRLGRRHPGRRPAGACAIASSSTTTPRPPARPSDSIVKKLLNDVPVRKGAADAAVAEVFRS